MGFHVTPYVADGLSVQNLAVQEVSGVQCTVTRLSFARGRLQGMLFGKLQFRCDGEQTPVQENMCCDTILLF